MQHSLASEYPHGQHLAVPRLPINVRNRELHPHVDAGFINRRLSYNWLSPAARRVFDGHIDGSGDERFTALRNDHVLIEVCLADATGRKVQGVRESLVQGLQVGDSVCGTEWLKPVPNIYDTARARARVDFAMKTDFSVSLEFSTEHIFSSTQKMVLQQGAYTTFVAIVHSISRRNAVTLHPLFMGGPMLGRDENDEPVDGELLWHSSSFYQLYPEDIDEFVGMKDVQAGIEWMDVMRNVPEQCVKGAFASILGDPTKKDWGGELNDHYASAVHAGGRRYEAAFLLKGPSDFREMVPAHLGKNADQIYRLACTPAGLLVVQHCHQIGEAVRATLKAFAYNPAHIRRYCLIDGKDTYRILKAYGFM